MALPGLAQAQHPLLPQTVLMGQLLELQEGAVVASLEKPLLSQVYLIITCELGRNLTFLALGNHCRKPEMAFQVVWDELFGLAGDFKIGL